MGDLAIVTLAKNVVSEESEETEHYRSRAKIYLGLSFFFFLTTFATCINFYI